MAIVKMNAFTLLTFEKYKGNLLQALQKFEDVHFQNLQNDDLIKQGLLNRDYSGEKVSSIESELSKVRFTLDKILPYVEKPKGLKGMMAPPVSISFDKFETFTQSYDYTKVYQRVKELDEAAKAYKAEKVKLQADNNNLRSWLGLDVSVKQFGQLKSVESIIGTINKNDVTGFRENIESAFPCVYVENLGWIKDEAGILILMLREEYEDVMSALKSLGFTRASLGFDGVPSEIIRANEDRIKNLDLLVEETLAGLKECTGEYDNLQISCDYFQTILERTRVSENFLKTETVLLIKGWVPEEEISEFTGIVNGVCGEDFYMEESKVEADDIEVPIKLKNNKLVSSFEGVTEMYSMPKYNEIDPTPLLTPFYMMFFGIMVGDAGYGLLLLVGSALALKYFNLKKGARKFIQFFHYLGYSTIIAGILFGSAFGFPVPLFQFSSYEAVNPATGLMEVMPKALFDSQLDIVTMIVASIGIGVAHILFGLGVKGYMLVRDGKIIDAVFDSLFWIITVVSVVALVVGAAGIIPPEVTNIAKWIFYASLVGLAATQGRQSPSLGGKIASGLYSVYGLSGYIGDFVSYTRLVALSLSGAYIAFAFLKMAQLLPGIWMYIFGTIIIILGGALNFGLAALGAYVHTCRLQYVEYFSKFYEGGGKPFAPFSLKNTFVNITK